MKYSKRRKLDSLRMAPVNANITEAHKDKLRKLCGVLSYSEGIEKMIDLHWKRANKKAAKKPPANDTVTSISV